MKLLVIKNISSMISTQSIRDLCKSYGDISKARRVEDDIHVEMRFPKQAKQAYKEISGMSLLGQPLDVELRA